jgi:hypothetical protein
MLDQMKGQPQSMYTVAHKLCARRFGKEEEIYFSGKIKFTWSYEASILGIMIEKNESEFDITKVLFLFSPKNCAESQNSDFANEYVWRPENLLNHVTIDPSPLCMKTKEVWGKYK